jgi:flagellar basal-body rod protein FlgF
VDDSLAILAINRQRGLRAELTTIANNIANLDTTGFRREGVLFAEHVHAGGGESVSMADLQARFASAAPGEVTITGGALDIAIVGEGYFAVETDEGPMLTRAGHFLRSEAGALVTPDGAAVLDAGGTPIALPPEGGPITVGRDGTVSADGAELARIGVFTAPPEAMTRIGRTAFEVAGEGFEPVAEPELLHGALEGSNVDAIAEIARMIEVTRAYEAVQGLIRDDDERIREMIRTLGQPL